MQDHEGDLDLNLRAKSTVFNTTLSGLFPSQVEKVALDAGWTMRVDKGLAVQLRAQPGIYSDLTSLSADSFSSPFSLSVVHTFDTALSGMAGLEIRSGFDLPVMPLIGIVWGINDDLTLDLRCPRSKFVYRFAKDWNTYLGLEWENTTYSLGGDNKDLTVNYVRNYLGIAHRMPNEMLIRGEIGTEFDRSVRFRGDPGAISQVDMDRAAFLRVGVGAAF